jgi:hypothetical protein
MNAVPSCELIASLLLPVIATFIPPASDCAQLEVPLGTSVDDLVDDIVRDVKVRAATFEIY